MKLEHFLTLRSNWSTKSTAAVTNSSLGAWFFSSVLWAKGEGFFRKYLMRKCMDIPPSILCSFFEAVLKRRQTVWESDLQRITFSGFKFDLRFLRILKLLLGIIYLIVVSWFHFRPMFCLYAGVWKYRSMD